MFSSGRCAEILFVGGLLDGKFAEILVKALNYEIIGNRKRISFSSDSIVKIFKEHSARSLDSFSIELR